MPGRESLSDLIELSKARLLSILFIAVYIIVSLSILVPIRIELYGDRWARALLSQMQWRLMVGYALSDRWGRFDYDQTKQEPKSRCQVDCVKLQCLKGKERIRIYLTTLIQKRG